MRLKPLLGWAVVAVAMTPLLLLSGVDRSQAGTFEPTLKVTLDNPEPEQSTNTTVDFGIPTGDVNFAAVVAFVPNEWGVIRGKDIPIGTEVGELSSTATLGLLNNACNQALPVKFTFYNSSLDINDTISFYDDEADDDTTPEFAEDSDGDERPDAVTKYPDFINRVLTDQDGNPLQPFRRSAGYTVVAGTAVLLQFLLFEPGTVIDEALPSDPALGYPSVTLLQNAGDPDIYPAPGPITDFCSPLVSSNIAYGETKDGSMKLQVSPQDGTYTFTVVSLGLRDADDDGYENSLDTCALDPNEGDPRVPNSGDPDADGLDAACDPDNDDTNSDEDLDGYLNRGDNCPLKANGQPIDKDNPTADETNQADKDKDQIGDVCDPEPDTANGELIFKQVTQDVKIGTGSGTGGPPAGFGQGGTGGGDDDSNTGLIIAIAAGVAAAVVVVGGGAYLLMRRGGGA